MPRGRRGERCWRYRVRWTSPVTGRRPPAEFATLDEAKAFYAQLDLARKRGEVAQITRGDITIDEFVRTQWWPRFAARRLERSTLRPYQSVYRNHIGPYVGHILVRRLTPVNVRDLRDELEDVGVGTPTVRRALSVLQSICRGAIEAGAIHGGVNPVREIHKPPVDRKLAIDPPTATDIEAILAELDHPRDRALVAVLGYEGPRPSETLALERRHIGDQTLTIEQRIVNWERIVPGQKGRGRAERATRSPTLWAPVRAALHEHLAEQPSGRHRLVFPAEHGGHWVYRDWRDWTDQVFRPAAARAGVDIGRPYNLRHGCAGILLHAGMPLTVVSGHLGNSVATLSRSYAHLIAEHAGKPAVPVLDQILQARSATRGEPMRPRP